MGLAISVTEVAKHLAVFVVEWAEFIMVCTVHHAPVVVDAVLIAVLLVVEVGNANERKIFLEECIKVML